MLEKKNVCQRSSCDPQGLKYLTVWLSAEMYGLSQVTQWSRTCLPKQETQETQVRSLGRERSSGEGVATHSSVLAWRSPWTEEPGGYLLWGPKESDTTKRLTLRFSQIIDRKNVSAPDL